MILNPLLPRLSIIVSWRDRQELGQALPSIVQSAQALGGEVVIVNFGGNDALLHQQIGERLADVRVVRAGESAFFNKAVAQNLGASHALADTLFFCDADIVLSADDVAGMFAHIHRDEGVFVTMAGVRETVVNARKAGHVAVFGYQLRLRLTNGRSLEIVDNEEDAANGTRQAPGILMVRRAHFEAVQGYNGALHGWGWEDQDMIARLTLGAGLKRINEGYALHISHDDAARIQFYPAVKDRWESRDRMFRTALSNYDQGLFLGTLNRDTSAITD